MIIRYQIFKGTETGFNFGSYHYEVYVLEYPKP